MRHLPKIARGFLRRRDGIAAVEFALVLPIFIVLLLSGTEYGRALSVSRKVTLTTRAVADLTTQYVQMSNADVATVLNASAQIVAPYPSTTLSIVLSEITTDALGVSTVTWSKTLNGTVLTPGQIIILPTGMTQPGTAIILSQVSYGYTPMFAQNIVGTMKLSDNIYMSPRLSATVDLKGS